MCDSDLIKYVLCKTFSNRRGLSLESYVWSAFQVPEDLLPFSSGLGLTLAFTQEKKRGLIWSVSQLGCMLGSSTHRNRCAQISRREQSIKGIKSEGRVGMGQWACQTSGQLRAAMAVGLHKWGVTWPQTSQPFQNGLLKKVSVSWLLQADTPTQDGSQSPVHRAWMPVPNHHYCPFPHSHRSLSCVGLFSSIDYWPKIFTLANFTQRHQRCLHFLRTGTRSPKSSLEITSCSAPQALLFQADFPLQCTKSFWSERVTSQLWRSVCTDPVRAVPSLCLFNTLSCCN